jgi:PAS domain S-box-containing protein
VSSADDVTERALAGEDVVFEWKIRRVSTGELVDCEVALRPIQWYGQQMILGVIRDISERKSTEAERQASRLYLEHSQTLAHVGHYSYDLRTRKLSWSRELLNIFGLDPDGPAPSLRDHRHLVPTAGYETMIQTLRKHASSLQPFGMEFEIRRADGQARVLDARIDWLRDAQGRATVQFGAIMDISEYKRAQEKIQTELEKLNGLREIDGFITNRYPLEETLKAVAGQAVRNLHVEAAWVMLSPAPGEPKRVVASAGQQQVDPISSEQIPAMFSQAPVIVCGEVQGVVMVKNPESVPQDVEWIDYLFSLAGQAAVAIDNARLFDGLQRTNLELQKAYDTAISGWSKALELRDKETQGHTDRIVRMAQDLALRVGLSEEELVHFRRGVYLHDIGKMGIPDSILLKTGPLTPEEWTVMRRHPEFAREWLEGNAYLAPALVIPYYHHERWNGSGYPCGLKGESIPLEARIFAVVDVWDALTHDRPYRAAELPEKVRAYLVENAGVQFDPRIVKAFLDILVETHHT